MNRNAVTRSQTAISVKIDHARTSVQKLRMYGALPPFVVPFMSLYVRMATCFLPVSYAVRTAEVFQFGSNGAFYPHSKFISVMIGIWHSLGTHSAGETVNDKYTLLLP